MKVYEAVADALVSLGYRRAYTIPGTHIYHLNHALGDKVQQTVFRHEMGATFAADAYGRLTGTPGLAIVTAGPGILNGLSGLGQAYAEASPLLYITGEVARGERYGFHGVDDPLAVTYSSIPVAKRVYLVEDPGSIWSVMGEAHYTALSGRRGPVHVSIPYDVLQSEAGEGRLEQRETDGVARCVDVINEGLGDGVRGVLIIGMELYPELAVQLLDLFVDWPYIATVGQIGMGGLRRDRYAGHIEKKFQVHPVAERVLREAEYILAIGIPPDSPEAEQISILNGDARIDYLRPGESGCIVEKIGGGYHVLAPLREAVDLLSPGRNGLDLDIRGLMEKRLEWARETVYSEKSSRIHQGVAAHMISQLEIDGYTVTCDTGGNEQWIREFIPPIRDVRYLYSGSFGSIGYSLPASIGAYDARPEVLAVTGDGSLMMSLGELKTVVEHSYNVKIAVFNDSTYGILEMLSRSDIGEEIEGGIGSVDFAKVAEALGMEAMAVETYEDLEEGLEELIESRGPFLLDIRCSPEEVPILLRKND